MSLPKRYWQSALVGLFLALSFLGLRLQGCLPSPSEWRQGETYEKVIARSQPAVVDVMTHPREVREDHLSRSPLLDEYRDQISVPGKQPARLGSGIVVDNSGHILTNYHVVQDAAAIIVRDWQQKDHMTELVGFDEESDLAVLRASQPFPHWLEADPDSARVGDVVLALGNPYGVGQTATLGIVSGVGRSNLGLARIENFIQTDAAINPGNSGGALIDTRGQLVGVTSGVFSSTGTYQGISFAIPAQTALMIAQEIIQTGHASHGYLGIELRNLSSDEKVFFGPLSQPGFLVTRTKSGGPAEQAGVRAGDVLLEIAGKKPENIHQAYALSTTLSPGTQATLTLLRRGATETVEVTVGEKTPRSIR